MRASQSLHSHCFLSLLMIFPFSCTGLPLIEITSFLLQALHREKRRLSSRTQKAPLFGLEKEGIDSDGLGREKHLWSLKEGEDQGFWLDGKIKVDEVRRDTLG